MNTLLLTLVVGAPPAVDYALDSPPPAAVSYGLDAPSGVKGLTPEKPKRVKLSGYWFTQHPDGRLEFCVECNGPYPAGGIPGYVVVDWNGYKPAVPAVTAPVPFQPGGTPGTGAKSVVAPLPLSPAPAQYPVATGTFVPVGIRGFTSRPCPPSG